MHHTTLLLLLLIMTVSSCTNRHPVLDTAITWELIDNTTGNGTFLSEFTLINNGSTPLTGAGWTLYFNLVRKALPDSSFTAASIQHLGGDFFVLKPAADFPTLHPGDSIVIPVRGQFWLIKESEAPSGLYLTLDDTGDAVTYPVSDYTVIPFTRVEQTSRSATDALPVTTPALRYQQNNYPALTEDNNLIPVVPTPVSFEFGTDQFVFEHTMVVNATPDFEKESRFLQQRLGDYGITFVDGGDATAGASITLEKKEGLAPESYELVISDDGIWIDAADRAGIFYGIQTLRQLLPPAATTTELPFEIEALQVMDQPRFGYRGMHLDVARNFQPMTSVKRLLEAMAFFKLNKFHFHVTDDEGWRLEIPGLPELTRIGSRRGHTMDETDHLQPALGSGPLPDQLPGSGYYNRQEFIEMLQFASDRHIEVIPEIDLPGHARAAIVSMNARQDDQFRLVHPDDVSTYESVQLYADNVIDVCLPSSYAFIEKVVDEVQDMYDAAGVPLHTIHMGGDEVPAGVWTQSPACETLLAEGTTLWTYFFERVHEILEKRNLQLAGWEEIALLHNAPEGGGIVPNPAFINHGFLPFVWNNVWGWGSEGKAYELANAGYDVVLSNVTNLYFDLAYEKNPEEPGYYWGAFVDTRKAFAFTPMDVYKSAYYNNQGQPINLTTYQDYPRLTPEGAGRIRGIQGQLWGETAITPEMMEYHGFPKLLGLAERAWAPRPVWVDLEDQWERYSAMQQDWALFAHRTGRYILPHLDHFEGGITYRIPPPGAIVQDQLLYANVRYPGLTIRFTSDGSEPTESSPVYDSPIPTQGQTFKLRSFSTTGRSSRSTTVDS